MSITNCPECGNQISTQASACPHCGYDFKAIRKKQSSQGCRKSMGIILLAGLAMFILMMALGGNSESKKDEKGLALKEAHCKLKWDDLEHADKKKVLEEFMENALYMTGTSSPEVLAKMLLKQSMKYPGTLEESGPPSRDVRDVRKGIIEYQNSFTSENKLGMKVKGHYWLKVKYNAGCKDLEVISFDVE